MADEQTSAEAPPAATQEAEAPAVAPRADEEGDWTPPASDERGFALDGHGLPINLRLRAAALADKGADTDPTGAVSAEAISAERARLADYDSRFPPLSASSSKAALERAAEAEGVDISSAANNEERAALILRARPART